MFKSFLKPAPMTLVISLCLAVPAVLLPQPEDLGDPLLLRESRAALDELTRILGIGSVYEFQR